MRALLRLVCALFVLACACTTTRQLTIERGQPGDRLARVSGDSLKLRRRESGAFVDLKPGYYTVASEEEWSAAAATGRELGALPPDVDLVEHMLVVAVADAEGVSAVRIDHVVDTSGALHVYLTESLRGHGCRDRAEHHPYDVVAAPRVVKPLRIHIEVAHGESCGDPPEAKVACRVAPSGALADTLSAAPGDTIDCEGTAAVRGVYPIVDRALRLSAIPVGSAAKLAFPAALRGRFTIDSYGRYTVKIEAVDDGGRKGRGVAHVDVMPPADGNVYLQQSWGGFDSADDMSTFPRVVLKLREEKAKAGGERECVAGSQTKVEGCEIKAGGGVTNAVLQGGSRRFRMSVFYIDERVDKGPRVCLRAFKDGKQTFEQCDELPRAAEASWDVGTFDVAGAGLYVAPAVDAGAPGDGGAPAAEVDGGAQPKKR